MLVFGLCFVLIGLARAQDVCQSVNCGSGVCILTQNPSLPYFCRCPSGSNTILPCPTENPCSRNPCGQGVCEVVPSLVHGYLCRCAGDAISLTSCNVTRNGCYSNPCINGLCIEGLTSFFCNCLPTWTGKHCSERMPSPCASNPCHPGRCFQLNDPAVPMVCYCQNEQFGLSCRGSEYFSSTSRMLTMSSITTTSTTTSTTSMASTTTARPPYACNPFDSRTCMNDGRCLATTQNFRCLCQAGFTGTFCEININECSSNPCQHGGICYDLQASYMCYCPDGSFRTQCTPHISLTSTARALYCPCQNGGECSPLTPQMCLCPHGFTGRYCESLIPADGCNEIQCSNGGTCSRSAPGPSGVAQCLCKNGYTGRYCETEYFQCRSNGRFVDVYNCIDGKYFECIHYHHSTGANPYGMLLSRSCPTSLRFNSLVDRCDYPQNVKCLDA